VLALLVKFQFAFLIPVVAVVGLKRHLFGRSSDPQHADRRDPVRVLTSLAAGLGSLVVLLLPFKMAIWSPGAAATSLIDKFLEASNTYSGLSINGFNLWRNPFSGLGDTLWRGCDAPIPPGCASPAGIAFQIGATAISWQLVGTVLFALVALAALWQIADHRGGLLRTPYPGPRALPVPRPGARRADGGTLVALGSTLRRDQPVVLCECLLGLHRGLVLRCAPGHQPRAGWAADGPGPVSGRLSVQ
jgi:hypothetical protein